MGASPEYLPRCPRLFFESYNSAGFTAAGITDVFVQDNQSCSVKGTLRGLHYQLRHAQAKLCRVVVGEALDVAVDIRFGSPTFGKRASSSQRQPKTNSMFHVGLLTDFWR
jgi:dTDP-4-dehydrorhamnose 3,5-epimerase